MGFRVLKYRGKAEGRRAWGIEDSDFDLNAIRSCVAKLHVRFITLAMGHEDNTYMCLYIYIYMREEFCVIFKKLVPGGGGTIYMYIYIYGPPPQDPP